MNLKYSDQTSLFFWEKLKKKKHKGFWGIYEPVQVIWKVRLTYIFMSVKKRDRTTHPSDYMLGKEREKNFIKSVYSEISIDLEPV